MDWTANKGNIMCLMIYSFKFYKQKTVFNVKLSCPNLNVFIILVVEYSCLGDWFVGKNHFFAVANTKESRKDEKYRCFLKNREDDYYLGASITPQCNSINTVEKVRRFIPYVVSLT